MGSVQRPFAARARRFKFGTGPSVPPAVSQSGLQSIHETSDSAPPVTSPASSTLPWSACVRCVATRSLPTGSPALLPAPPRWRSRRERATEQIRQLVTLPSRERSRRPRLETIEHDGPEAYAHEPFDLETERFTEASNLAVAPLGDGDLELRLAVPQRSRLDRTRQYKPV